jgi:hypothetical protein
MNRQKQPRAHETALNPPQPPIEAKRRELAGERSRQDQNAFLDQSEVDAVAPLTPTDVYQGELKAGDAAELSEPAELPDDDDQWLADLAAGVQPLSVQAELSELETLQLLADVYEVSLPANIVDVLVGDTDSLDMLTALGLRTGETADPQVAADEGATYVPLIDPPVVPGRAGSRANAEIASGFGISSLEEPYDESHHGSFLPADDEMSARVREALRADSSTSCFADRIAIETRDGVVILRGVVDDLIDNDNALAIASDVAGVVEVVDGLRVRGM